MLALIHLAVAAAPALPGELHGTATGAWPTRTCSDELAARWDAMHLDLEPTGSTFVSAVADVNEDGVEDVLVGSPTKGRSGKSQRAGRVELLSGSSGLPLADWDGYEPSWHLGSAVAGLGDTDGDGKGDFAFGAPGALSGRGRVALVSGAEPDVIRWIDATAEQEFFGFALSGGRDATGDGARDLAVGGPAKEGRGSVTLIDGASGEVLWIAQTESEAGMFGFDVELIPDLDEDGLADVLVGHLGSGAVALSGADGAELFRLGDASLGKRIGYSVAALERPDMSPLLLLVNTDFNTPAGREEPPEPGIHVFESHTRSRPDQTTISTPSTDAYFTIGMRVRGIGDLDGDGHEDLAICQPTGMPSFGPIGAVNVLSCREGVRLARLSHYQSGMHPMSYLFGTDACVIRSSEGESGGSSWLVVACGQSVGGVSALDTGSEYSVEWYRED